MQWYFSFQQNIASNSPKRDNKDVVTAIVKGNTINLLLP